MPSEGSYLFRISADELGIRLMRARIRPSSIFVNISTFLNVFRFIAANLFYIQHQMTCPADTLLVDRRIFRSYLSFRRLSRS